MNAITRVACVALTLIPAVTAFSQRAPEQATALMAKAQAQAKLEKKAVFVVFDASW